MPQPPYAVPDPVYLYHITHVRNLPAILTAGGLLCYRLLHEAATDYTNIAHDNIQQKRARQPIPCGPGGNLHDYVPFYFGPRSPMLYVNYRGNVEGYDDGQEPIIHIVTSLEAVQQAALPFVFSNGHGIMVYTDFYDDPAHLNQVDFPLMRERYWRDENSDLNRSWRRQAEFLVHESVPWGIMQGIVVMNEPMEERVKEILDQHGVSTPTGVRRTWYY